MSEAAITINGTGLTEEEAAIVRLSVEAFTAVMSQGVDEQDEDVVEALTDNYKQALLTVQKLLDVRPESRIQ